MISHEVIHLEKAREGSLKRLESCLSWFLISWTPLVGMRWLLVMHEGNLLTGSFPPPLLSLPSTKYLDVSSNKFTSIAFQEFFSCNKDLQFVNLSSNLLKPMKLSRWILHRVNNRNIKEKQAKHYLSYQVLEFLEYWLCGCYLGC